MLKNEMKLDKNDLSAVNGGIVDFTIDDSAVFNEEQLKKIIQDNKDHGNKCYKTLQEMHNKGYIDDATYLAITKPLGNPLGVGKLDQAYKALASDNYVVRAFSYVYHEKYPTDII